MMPEITDKLRHVARRVETLPACQDVMWEFLRDSIREHYEGQLPVDVEYLLDHPLHGENRIDDEWSLDITSSGVSLYRKADGSYYDVDRELVLPVKTVKQLDALLDLFGFRIVGGN